MSDYDISMLDSALEFDTTEWWYISSFKIDSTHVLVCWTGSDNDGFAQVFEVDTWDYSVSKLWTALEFDTLQAYYNSIEQIDENHFICFYTWYGFDGFATVLEVNLSTWAVTEPWSALEFDTSNCSYNSCIKMSENTFVNVWNNNSYGGNLYAQVFTVNTSTWAITWEDSPLSFSGDSENMSIDKIDDTHFIISWCDTTTNDGFIQAFSFNGSYEITAEWTAVEFDTSDGENNTLVKIDNSTFMNFWKWVDGDGFCRIFTVDGSYNVTAEDSAYEFDTSSATNMVSKSGILIDSNHILYCWQNLFSAWSAQVLTWNGSYEISTEWTGITNLAGSFWRNFTITEISAWKYFVLWTGSGSDGYVQMMDVEWVTAWWATFLPKITWF